MIKNSVLVYEKLDNKEFAFAVLSRNWIIKQDDYGELELWLSEVDYRFGAETLRLESLARIFLSKTFDRNLWNKPERIMIHRDILKMDCKMKDSYNLEFYYFSPQ